MSTTKIIAISAAVILIAVLGITFAIEHHHAHDTPPVVKWAAPHAVDSTSQTAEREIEAQLGRFAGVTRNRNPNDAIAILSPQFIGTAPGSPQTTYAVISQQFASGVAAKSLAQEAPDAYTTVTVTSCRIEGNNAVVGVEDYGHGTATQLTGDKGATTFVDQRIVGTLTFVKTGGQWLMSRSDTTQNQPLPYHPG